MRFDENLRNKGLTEAFRTSSLIRQKTYTIETFESQFEYLNVQVNVVSRRARLCTKRKRKLLSSS